MRTVLSLALLVGTIWLQTAEAQSPALSTASSAGCGTSSVVDDSNAQWDAVTGQIEHPHGYKWRYGYQVRLSETHLCVRVSIKLVPAGGVTAAEIERAVTRWEAGIERIWSDRYALSTPAGDSIPILVDISFQGPAYDHHVIVRPGAGASDELNWNLLDPSALAAHEVGHMLGLFDEYDRGALDPDHPVVDSSSIMTNTPQGTCPQRRHYEPLLQWFVARAGLQGTLLREQSPF